MIGTSGGSLSIQVAAQNFAPGAGGIARCASMTLRALVRHAEVKSALAAADSASYAIGRVATRAFHGRRLPFAAANTLGGLSADLVFYDFSGTGRAHRLLEFIGKPYVVWVHGREIWSPVRADYARVIRKAAAVFCNSRHTAALLRESVPGLANVHVCWLGTERDDDEIPSPSAGAKENVVLFVGRNDELFAKGQDRLIAAWPEVVAAVPDATLRFVGGGANLERLRLLASASPARDSIQVLGWLPDAEVERLYPQAKVFAMLSRSDGFGLVYVEAMSHAVPVITSTNDASHEINRDGATGYSIDRDDRVLLVERIVALLSDANLHKSLAAGARRHWQENFSFSSFANRLWQTMQAAGLAHG